MTSSNNKQNAEIKKALFLQRYRADIKRQMCIFLLSLAQRNRKISSKRSNIPKRTVSEQSIRKMHFANTWGCSIRYCESSIFVLCSTHTFILPRDTSTHSFSFSLFHRVCPPSPPCPGLAFRVFVVPTYCAEFSSQDCTWKLINSKLQIPQKGITTSW